MPTSLIPALDPAPLPGPPWLFHLLWVLTFVIHLLFVNMVLGGSLLAAALLVFLFDFTSFGVILLLGGPRFATLEVEIYIQALSMLNLPLAGVLSAVQLLCTLLITLAYTRLGGRQPVPLAPRLRGEGTTLRRGTLLTLALTILVWLCVCGLGAALMVLRYLGPK